MLDICEQTVLNVACVQSKAIAGCDGACLHYSAGGVEAGGLQVPNLVCHPEILANCKKCKEWPIPGALFTKNGLAGVTPHPVTFYSMRLPTNSGFSGSSPFALVYIY